MTQQKSAVFLYEPSQVERLTALITDEEGKQYDCIIVSLDAEIDYLLEKRGISFISGKSLQNRDTPSSYIRAADLTQALCESDIVSSFVYRGVPLIEPLRFSLHAYFIDLLYYIELFAHFAETFPDTDHFVIPASAAFISKRSSFLAEQSVSVVVEAARTVAHSRGFACKVVYTAPSYTQATFTVRRIFFLLKRSLFGMGISALNMLVALRTRRPICILASDYWRNLEPTLRQLPDAEVVLLDRSEALNAGFSNIWRHRMRFVHIEHFLSGQEKRRALIYAKTCMQKWLSVREASLGAIDTMFCGVSLAPLCEKLMVRLVERAFPRAACTIGGTYSLYERFSPDAVLVRASVSEQLHFSVLSLAAREVKIPALEVQHGIEYLGPGSPTKRHAAYFFAAYGRLVCDEFKQIGYALERLRSAGSPRFDFYVLDAQKASLGEKGSSLRILSNTPTASIIERFGSYSLEEYFKALGDEVRKIPNASLAIASRSTSVRPVFQTEATRRGLSEVSYQNVGTTPLPILFTQTDVFVCSFSTVVYEALLYHLPVVLVAFAPVEKMMVDFHFSSFEEEGVLAIARSPRELAEILKTLAEDAGARTRMTALAQKFMADNFSFDGDASKRIAEFIRSRSR